MRGQARQLSSLPSFLCISRYEINMFTVPWYIPGWITVVPAFSTRVLCLSLGISWIVIRPAPLNPMFILRRFSHYWNKRKTSLGNHFGAFNNTLNINNTNLHSELHLLFVKTNIYLKYVSPLTTANSLPLFKLKWLSIITSIPTTNG